jgi:predicted AAA+ superfamily ATPase
MSYSSKHKILKTLKTHWDNGEERTTGSYTVNPLGRSLSIIQLSKRTKLSSDKVQDLCDTLEHSKLIDKFKEDTENKSHYYIINDFGKSYVIDKIFFYKVWYRNFNFWKFVLPFLIGLAGLLNSIFGWWTVN